MSQPNSTMKVHGFLTVENATSSWLQSPNICPVTGLKVTSRDTVCNLLNELFCLDNISPTYLIEIVNRELQNPVDKMEFLNKIKTLAMDLKAKVS